MIELLIVIAVIAILSIVVILTLNPAQIIMSSRDSNRVSDMATMTSAISLYLAEGGTGLGSSSIVYVSIPDPTATSTAGDQCQGLSLISLPSNYSYHCAASSTFRNVNGTGWIPINFSSLPAGSPLGNLPIDPTNNSSSRLYYTYDTNGSQYEVTSAMESQKYQLGGSNDVIANDGGTLASVYEKGSVFGLEPLDYGDNSLVGYWPLNEGTGTITYDDSGGNATGSWSGIQIGSNGTYYTTGKIGPYAGAFDGTSTYINVPDHAALDPTNAITISMWVDEVANLSPDGYETILEKNSSAGYMPRITAGQIYDVGGMGAGYHAETAGTVATSTWTLLTTTYNGAIITNYVNGVVVGQSSLSGSINAAGTPLLIGGRMAGGTGNEVLNGSLDDVRIYNRALTAVQIAAMYTGGK